MPKMKGRTPEQQIRDAERRKEALELKRAGLTYDQIAVRMGYSHRGQAQQLVKRAIRDLWIKPAEDVRNMELEKLDHSEDVVMSLVKANLPKAKVGRVLPARIVLKALEARNQIIARRAKLIGLDAPQKHEHTGKDGAPIEVVPVTADELLERIARIASAGEASADPSKPITH